MKKILSLLLSLSILCGVPTLSFAEAPADNLNEVLTSVKSRITIPSNYDAFLSDSYTDENGTEYTFSWESGDSSTSVTANENGIISSYLYTNNDVVENSKAPVKKTSQSALYKAACGYVRKLNPNIYNKLKVTFGTNAGGDCRYFELQRYENNIPVEGNSGYIAVSSDGKILKDFSLTYTTGIEFEKADKIISRSAAQKAYADKIGFSLFYGSKYDDSGIAAVPMYTTVGEYTKYISAINDNLINLNDITYIHDDSEEQKSGAVPYPNARDEYAEPNELKGMAGIISASKAEKIARSSKIINIPENYTLRSTGGFKNADNENKCFYTLLFVGEKSRDYAEVMIDAKSGEILHFGKTQNAGKNVITKEKAKEIAQNAVENLAPKHINDYILGYAGDNGVFSFIRTVNGIEFPANQIEVYVDMTNGNVIWYDFSYSDIKFPSLKKVLPSDIISKISFDNSDFGAVYVLNCSKPGMTEQHVYKFGNSDVTEFDAITGRPMWE